MDIGPIVVLMIALALIAFSISSRTQQRDRGNGLEVELRPPGEPGNDGDRADPLM